MISGKTFGPRDTVVLKSGDCYQNCVFNDCEIVGNPNELRDMSFTSCEMTGRAGTWMMDYLNNSRAVLMSVDLRTGEVTPGPASDNDPSFPSEIKRQ